MEENVDAAQIYVICRNQLIMSMNGPIDINHLAIHEAMRLYGVENRRECFEKVVKVSDYFLEKYRRERDADR